MERIDHPAGGQCEPAFLKRHKGGRRSRVNRLKRQRCLAALRHRPAVYWSVTPTLVSQARDETSSVSLDATVDVTVNCGLGGPALSPSHIRQSLDAYQPLPTSGTCTTTTLQIAQANSTIMHLYGSIFLLLLLFIMRHASLQDHRFIHL